jgi:hypothetical protein
MFSSIEVVFLMKNNEEGHLLRLLRHTDWQSVWSYKNCRKRVRTHTESFCTSNRAFQEWTIPLWLKHRSTRYRRPVVRTEVGVRESGATSGTDKYWGTGTGTGTLTEKGAKVRLTTSLSLTRMDQFFLIILHQENMWFGISTLCM